MLVVLTVPAGHLLGAQDLELHTYFRLTEGSVN